MNKKGGFTIVGLILTFVTLAIYVGFLPALNEIISTAIPELDSMSATIISLIPMVMLIMIIVGMIQFGQVRQELG
jgi:uncharacterized membrane protein